MFSPIDLLSPPPAFFFLSFHQTAMSEARSKLSALEDAYSRTVKDLEEANSHLKLMQVDRCCCCCCCDFGKRTTVLLTFCVSCFFFIGLLCFCVLFVVVWCSEREIGIVGCATDPQYASGNIPLIVLEDTQPRPSCLFCLQIDNLKQQELFEAKVSELDVAAKKISGLEDSVARYVGRQRELEEELQVICAVCRFRARLLFFSPFVCVRALCKTWYAF